MDHRTEFRFAPTDSIGAAGAEDDREFLHECFVDTGLLTLLRDLGDPRLILVGRTGAGKSALLNTLEDQQPAKVIRIAPEQLALTYVANSTILNFFSSIGVNLDPFLKLLWRHVLTVEILARHFANNPIPEQTSFIDRLRQRFMGATKSDRDMQQGIAYLEEWGKSFWEDTEYRVKEITSQVESRLDAEMTATLGSKAAGLGTSARLGDVLTDTERAELINRGQSIVSKAQVQDLAKILGLVDTLLADRQSGYYLLIDGLDESWVEEGLRYRLIMALMQTARDFGSVRHAKVILALRRDLLERVFRLTRESGFQEEKYQSLYLPVVWRNEELLAVLDRRVARLVSRRYTKAVVTHRDVLPASVEGRDIGSYMCSIAQRPRDIIAFFNACILAASNQERLAATEVRLAEGEYSRGRLRALADEWSADYPTLADFAALLQKRTPSFQIASVTNDQVSEMCLSVAAKSPGGLGQLAGAMQVVDGVLAPASFKITLFAAFYRVGLVGLRLSSHDAVSWVDELGRSISTAEIDESTTVVVHPAVRRALGVSEAKS